MAPLISDSVTLTQRSTTVLHNSKVTAPGSTPPAVPSDSVGTVSYTHLTLPTLYSV